MLSKFPNSSLKVGAPVSLSPQHKWNPGHSNPIGVRGRVATSNPYGIQVEWESGRINSYSTIEHDLICEGEPGYLEVE
jgi:hypothetical protein